MLTNHVYQKFQASQRSEQDSFFSRIDFFNIGTVEFKGVSQNVYDIIFLPEEKNRLKLRDTMDILYQNLEKKMWKTKVFMAALDVASGAIENHLNGCRNTPAGRVLEGQGLVRNQRPDRNLAQELFDDESYEGAISTFSEIIDEMTELKQIDRIAVEYLQLVKQNYKAINDAFIQRLDEEVNIRVNDLFGPKERTTYLLLKKHQAMYKSIKSGSRLKLKNRKTLWLRTTAEAGEDLNTNLQSFK